MGKTSATTRRRRKLPGNNTGEYSANHSSEDNNDDERERGPQRQQQQQRERQQQQQQQSTWTIVKNHPAVWVLILIGIPYGLNLGFRHTVLQTDLLRPPVGRKDRRQVLILGSMMSFGGISKNARNHYDNNMASTLRREFGLEIGYEDSDSSWNFVRDGTASWMHGIRYLEREREGEGEAPGKGSFFDRRIRYLCRLRWALTHESRDRYGFEQSVFGSDADFNNCSVFNPDSRRCQLPVCEESINKEYGCALEASKGTSTGTGTGTSTGTSASYAYAYPSCDPMPFQTTLLQTRQPWHIVRSLVETYCWGKNSVREDMPSSLEDLLSTLGWIPRGENSDSDSDSESENENESESENERGNSTRRGHCVNQFIDYVASYYNTVLDRGADVKAYRIEDTSPCEVAELAGLLGSETTVHAPNHERIRRRCDSDSDSATGAAEPRPAVSVGSDDDDDDDLEVVSVTRHLLPHVTPEHLERMRELFARLGYDYSEE